MSYLPSLHYCCSCKVYLGPENGDGMCSACETKPWRCHCGRFLSKEFPVCWDKGRDQPRHEDATEPTADEARDDPFADPFGAKP